jgi:hypothetical protein
MFSSLFLWRHRIVRAAAHQDESPAEYSLTGCSSALPISAFPAASHPQPEITCLLAFFSKRITVTWGFVSIRVSVQYCGTN